MYLQTIAIYVSTTHTGSYRYTIYSTIFDVGNIHGFDDVDEAIYGIMRPIVMCDGDVTSLYNCDCVIL